MYTVKGFITVDGLGSNNPSVTNPIGDLSDLARTFALGIGEYNTGSSAYTLNTFYSATASGPVLVPSALQTQIFAFVAWAFGLQQGNTPAISAQAFTTAMTTQFGSQASAIGCGNLINAGTFNFPEYITWTNTTVLTNDPAQGAQVTLWFADASFQSQYDKYVIKVVPPLPLATLLSGASAVASGLAQTGPSTWANNLTTARGGYPETEILSVSYDYVDPTNSQNQITTNWSILVYGAAGNNVDAIRTAIQAYIAANSNAPQSTWQNLFPEIYISTEFLLIPRWQNVAIAQQQLQAGVYSEVINLAKESTYLKTVLSTFSGTFIDAHAAVLPTNYKSLVMLVVPNPANATAEQDITNLFPDLINVPTSDTSYNLMSTKTRGWLSMIQAMLIAAENATVQSQLPAGMSTATRNNVLYVAQEYSGITYLVATKGATPHY